MLANVWGLCALAAIPLIIYIHLFRKKFPPRSTSTLFLWDEPQRYGAAGRVRDRLYNRRSLWAEIIAVLAFTWFLCDPHLGYFTPARHVIFILDQHQRLRAVDDQGVPSLTHLKNEALAVIDDLRIQDRVSVIGAGSRSFIMSGPASLPADAAGAIRSWNPQHPPASAESALRLAQAIGDTSSAIIWLGDEPPQPWSHGIITTRHATNNHGITGASFVDDTSGQYLFVRILAADSQTAVPIIGRHLSTDSSTIFAQAIAQPGSRERHVRLPIPDNLPKTSEHKIRIEIRHSNKQGDALAVDDQFECFIRPPSVVRVQLAHITGRAAWERALRASGARIVSDTEPADLIIRPAHTQDSNETAGLSSVKNPWDIVIHSGPSDTNTQNISSQLGPFPQRAGHTVLAGIDTTGLLWSAEKITLPGETIMSAGGHSLLSVQSAPHWRGVHINIAWSHSRLERHPAFPALVANIIRWRRDTLPGIRQSLIPLGAPLRLVIPASHSQVTALPPNGEPITLFADSDGIIQVAECDHIGEWRWYLGSQDEIPHSGEPWQRCMVYAHHLQTSQLWRSQAHVQQPTLGALASVERQRGLWSILIPLCIAGLSMAAALWYFQREGATR